jgi:DNA-binding LytR/AlgR family response regulator
MYKIVLCDDEDFFIKKMKCLLMQYAKENQESIQIQAYSSGTALLKNLADTADLYFLDIKLKDISGMELAAMIRAAYPTVILVFVSSLENAVYHSFQYKPFRFIRKEFLKEELRETLTAFFAMRKQHDSVLCLHTTSAEIVIPIISIIYVETFGHYLYFYDSEKRYTVRGKLSDYASYLSSYFILQISQSYLVNMRFIASYYTKRLILYNGIEVNISRHYQASFKEEFLNYKRSQYHVNIL